jgi:uncharacterized protein
MKVSIVTALFCTFLVTSVSAQSTTGRRLVRAIGEASVSVRPDAARVTISIVKQATTADAAASENATATAAVIAALRQLLGATADIRTVGYHLTPVYVYPRDNTPPQLTGFTGTNTIQAVANDTTLAGRIVDTAVTAGASRIDGVSLFLKDEDASRTQALRLASQRARSKADAIALGLGVRLGAVLMAQEGYSSPILPVGRIDTGATAVTAPTPIEAGTLEVRATVTLDIEIAP